MAKRSLKETERFLEVIHKLRRECPWDREQTHKSLIPYLIEESYEAVEAIEKKNFPSLKEELGDVLLQVVLHAEIASEKKRFDFEDVAKAITDKMVSRHPHVFAGKKMGLKEHSKRWTELKEKEKPKRGKLEGTPKALPALQLSQRYGEIASSVGFDWKEAAGTFSKIKEEILELEAEVKKGKKKEIGEEFGDLLFALTNLARHLGVDAERSLRGSAEKFASRFRKMELMAEKAGKKLSQYNVDQLEELWVKAKK